MPMNTVIIENADNKAVAAFKQMASALGLKARTEKTTEKSPYDPEFVAQIRESEKDFAEGRLFGVIIIESFCRCQAF